MSDRPSDRAVAMPGLAKVRRVAVAARRSLNLVGLREGWFSSMIDDADIVSEGAVQVVDGVESYFGSTSLRCLLVVNGESESDFERLAELVLRDPNARLRLLRLAHREAVSRAGARALGVLTAEIAASLELSPSAQPVLAIDIDVSAGLADANDRVVDKR